MQNYTPDTLDEQDALEAFILSIPEEPTEEELIEAYVRSLQPVPELWGPRFQRELLRADEDFDR